MEEYEQYLKYSGTTTFSSMSKADLTNLVERGESSFLEFKQKVTSPKNWHVKLPLLLTPKEESY